MRRLLSEVAGFSGSSALRLLIAAALAGSVPFALAQQTGPAAGGHIGAGFPGHMAGRYAGHAGSSSGHSFAGYSAPNFVSTFGPHSITGTPGANFVLPSGRNAPDFASSWGIAHPVWRGEDGGWNRGRRRDRDRDHDRDRDRDRFRGGFGYPFLPVYNSWALMPWDIGYQDMSGSSSDNSQNATAGAPEYNESASPQDEYRPPYDARESDYAPPPPASSAPAVVASSTVLESEPALTLIFKDGHQQSIRNYALTGDAVIDLDKAATGRQERIPLADLNLPATEQAAQAAGLEFEPPR